ncbi:hypothetical protein FPY71_10085 [Aureimonas fodinaquatilis]|uniref:Uncharacterized protein n=1 Tax=Aureimonas fodinaquatilis TaxID=2565783 RepID=A0A5B0DY61_9HYPH|nr:hypothetical protein [Aureimonas fodinaquatilis]KAA0970815.1 hypothetical protein FPY71_10085 [Aureimonas fodinaquatilis]
MANVKNGTDRPLALPTGGIIPAGRAVKVKNWDTLKSHPTIKGWLAAKAVEVEVERFTPETKIERPRKGS